MARKMSSKDGNYRKREPELDFISIIELKFKI